MSQQNEIMDLDPQYRHGWAWLFRNVLFGRASTLWIFGYLDICRVWGMEGAVVLVGESLVAQAESAGGTGLGAGSEQIN